jgi:hypothetical protein
VGGCVPGLLISWIILECFQSVYIIFYCILGREFLLILDCEVLWAAPLPSCHLNGKSLAQQQQRPSQEPRNSNRPPFKPVSKMYNQRVKYFEKCNPLDPRGVENSTLCTRVQPFHFRRFIIFLNPSERKTSSQPSND